MWVVIVTCWVRVDAFHFRFHILTLADEVIEWGICWLLILFELIAGSMRVRWCRLCILHSILHTVLSASIFKVQGAIEKNCIRGHELNCFHILRGSFFRSC